MIDDHIARIEGYSIIRQDRNTGGGGVILYIRNFLRAKVLARSNTERRGKPLEPEYLMCEIWGEGIPSIFVGVLYRPPDVSFNANPDFLSNFRELSSSYSHKVIVGDLNSDLMVNSSSSRFVQNLARELSLQLVNHGPTHRSLGSDEPKTWIDIIWVDNNDKILTFANKVPSFHSHHNLIDVEIELYKPQPPSELFTYRKFNDITPEDINEILMGCEWTLYENPGFDIHLAVNNLNANIQTAIDQLAPLKTINPKKNKQPWINGELKLLIKKRKAIEKRYLRTKNPNLLKNLIELSGEVEKSSEFERNSFYQKHINDALENNKDIWRELRHLGLLPKPKSDLHGFSPDEINKFFSNVSYSSSENLNDSEDLINNAPSEGFQFTQVSLNDVILAVAHFSSQATGDDGIPQKVIAKSLPTIGPYLVKLFNESLSTGIFPLLWKKSLLVAIKKTPIPSSCSDFRPVALLCFLSKVLEKLVHDQITSYFKNNNLLDPLQTGFKRYSSTETALLKLTDDIQQGMNKKQITLLMQFDFSKAFDTISPSKLLTKLIELGFSKMSLLWISSYLQSRSLQVISKSSRSDPLNVNLGVPQGSILGPLLFCLYINDVKLHLPNNVHHILYADDLQVYCQVSPDKISEAIDLLSKTARNVSDWAKDICLRLNQGKTKAIYFGTSTFVNRLNRLNLPGIDLGNGIITPFVEEVTSLGVILDSRLNWDSHITNIEKKVNRVLYTLRFIRYCTTETLRTRLVQALIIPHLDYCTVIYSNACRKLRERLQRLCNTGLRYIFGTRKHEHITPFRRKLGWLSTDTRRHYFMAIAIYKILRFHQPPYLIDFFNKYVPKENARGHLRTKEIILPSTKECGISTFRYQGAKLWNSLPAEVRFKPSLDGFKAALHKYLFTMDL